MRKAIALIGAACAGTMLSGCMPQTPVKTRNSSLTQGNVQMRLVVGRTTKADVLEAFGAPNVTTRDGFPVRARAARQPVAGTGHRFRVPATIAPNSRYRPFPSRPRKTPGGRPPGVMSCVMDRKDQSA